LLRKRLPLGQQKAGLAVIGLELAVGVEARRFDFTAAFWKRPLDSAAALQKFIIKAGVVAEPAGRNALPLLECVARLCPARKKFVVATQPFCQVEKNLEVGAGFARRLHGGVYLADAPLRIRVSAFFFAPGGGRQNQVGYFGCRGGVKSVLHHEKVKAVETLLQHAEVREGHERICGDDPKSADFLGDGPFDNVRIGPASRSGNALRVDAPQRGQFFTICGALEFTVTGQAGREACLACAHRVALAGDREG